jgi:hypothetical protein
MTVLEFTMVRHLLNKIRNCLADKKIVKVGGTVENSRLVVLMVGI